MRSNYNSAVQAGDIAAGEFSVADNCFYCGYLSYADYMIVFDTIVSSVGLRTPFKTLKRVWSIKFGVRQALALVYYMYCADYNCLFYSYSAVLLVPDLLVCTMLGTFLGFSEFRTQVDRPKGP